MQPILIKPCIQALDSMQIAHLMRIEMQCPRHGIVTIYPFHSNYKEYKKSIDTQFPCPIGSCNEDMVLTRK
jgi:hypothetical protein